MLKFIFKYGLALLFFSMVGVLAMDYIILPNYVGYDNEHYLPDVRGNYLQKAKYTLTSLGFRTEIVTIPFSESNPPGTVVKMSPRSFTKVTIGRSISLTIAGHREDIIIPDYTSFSLRNARINASREGLVIDTVMYEFNDNIADGHISFQVPKSGHIVKSGALITFGVSKGNPPDYYTVPDLIGKSLKSAKKNLAVSGLRLGELEYEYQPDLLENTIIDQNFTPGLRVTFPAAVDLIVSTEKEFQ
jgi:beta-lactam-binding protein with PASTA domain|tara:strand:+ start:5889 stop:6623 length:735 start_codon:yes stop_codon:yes gene_type:complete